MANNWVSHRYVSNERQEQIANAFESKGVRVAPCVKCGGNVHRMVEVVLKMGVLLSRSSGENVHFHFIMVICQNCGYKSEFSKPELGLYDPS